jgi:RNA polymerase sigma factor (sigma-70 family)
MSLVFGQFGNLKLRDVPSVALSDRARFFSSEVESRWPSPQLNGDVSDIPMLKWRTAWAIGFNLTLGFADSTGDQSGSAIPRNVQTHLRNIGDKTVQDVLDRLWFDDLVRSVAAEQVGEWQPDDCRPLDQALAERTFVSLFRQYVHEVATRVSKRLGKTPESVESFIDDAWGRAFECYWSKAASSRYRAAASIPGTIALIAIRLAWRSSRESPWPRMQDGSDFEFPVNADPSKPLVDSEEQAEEQRKIDCLFRTLPPRQRLIAELVLKCELSQVEVAKRLGTSEANISILLKKAREKLQSAISRLSSDQ